MNYRIIRMKVPLIREDMRTNNKKISRAEDVGKRCHDLADMAQESIHLLTLDTGNHIIDRHLLTLGTVNSAPLDVRAFYRTALADDAVSVIAVHGHPAGGGVSREDVDATRRLAQAGETIGVKFLDHCVIYRDRDSGEICVHSIRETNPEVF